MVNGRFEAIRANRSTVMKIVRDRKPWFSYLMPLFFVHWKILDVDFCGGGDTASGKAKQ